VASRREDEISPLRKYSGTTSLGWGGQRPGYWQADALGEIPPSDFPKFPLGTETISGTDATGNGGRRRRDKHLREKPADIDGVRWGQERALVSSRREGLLHEALAVVRTCRPLQAR